MQKSSETTLFNGSMTVLYGSDEFPVRGSTGGVVSSLGVNLEDQGNTA